VSIPVFVRIEIEPSELPHASTSPNSWGANATELTETKKQCVRYMHMIVVTIPICL